MNDNAWSHSFRALLPDLLAILFFLALSFAYFFHPVTEGLVLTGHDHSGGAGAAHEMQEYREHHNGERTRWTNTLFSGMPTYQMAPSYPSTERLNRVERFYKLYLPDYVVLVFVMLLGFYILLRAFNFKAWMAALGAVMWAFSSYYFIIIGAGHIWKFYTLAYIPPTIAGMVLCYRGRYLWGALVTAFFMALQVVSNHVQMSYYFAFVIALMALAFLVEAVKAHPRLLPLGRGEANALKENNVQPEGLSSLTGGVRGWVCATAVFALGCLIGVAINISNLYHTWEYSRESMRGKSELTQKTKDPANQTSSGLERDYITAWSYGIGETWTLLVPNIKGGASNKGDHFVSLAESKTAMAKANPTYVPVYKSLAQYWGEQPGTSGPVYVGAFVLFLFVLGLFIVKGPMKWALFAATLLSITLAWGKNFMPWTNFFLDYIPMYDKFRTVASILVIAEFTIPLLAMLALRNIVEEEDWFARHKTAFGAALALTGGFALLFWLMPDVFFGTYVSSGEMQMLQDAVAKGYIPQDMFAPILANLHEMRRAVMEADAGRSLLIILVGCAVLAAYYFKKISAVAMTVCLLVLCTADLWDVNKRYLSDDMFSAPQPPALAYQKTLTDEAILLDTATYYRVANLAVSTFNDNTTSYWHKSIGGYHAAKLRRYQELIEAYLQNELFTVHQTIAETGGRLDSIRGDSLFPVLNMLNMKYAIVPLKDQQTLPVQNPWAMGNAWMVDNVKMADNADEELAALGQIDIRKTAVMDRRFTEALPAELTATRQSSTNLPTLNPQPSTSNPQPSTSNSQLSTFNSQPSTFNSQPSTSIRLTAYEANALSYEADTEGGLAVFSDIYYPGWRCTIDGQETEVLRANYVLRAVVLPKGRHTVTFTFDPQTLHTTEAIANIGLIALLLLFVGLIGSEIWRRKKE
ncbi:MAG: YfhO family protein [Bacteroidaceae bacterium]|nr:YfhO family protein [Bacteroidaceae bacterium]